MRYDRQAAEKLRAELGITEECHGTGPRGRPSVGTAGEVRALQEVLRLSGKQFSARFRVSVGTLQEWRRRRGDAPICPKEECRELLERALVRARELGLVKFDPKETKPTVPRPESTLVRYRCSDCGKDLRKKELELRNGEFVHAREDGTGNCGPVQIEDRRLKRRMEARMEAEA